MMNAYNNTSVLWKKCPICGNAVLLSDTNRVVVGEDWFHSMCTHGQCPTAPNWPAYPIRYKYYDETLQPYYIM